jgi:large subunit ribosomal protein L19
MSTCAIIQEIEEEQLKKETPDFKIGDTVAVHLRIVEGDKERTQVLTGTVISRKGSGVSETFSIHRVVYGTGMERLFFLHSPRVSNIEVTRRGKVRQAKLYYLRGTYGKKAKVKERIGVKAKKKKPAAIDKKSSITIEAAEPTTDTTSAK